MFRADFPGLNEMPPGGGRRGFPRQAGFFLSGLVDRDGDRGLANNEL